jgi:hypothetical protein
MAVTPEESDDEDEYTEASYEDEVDPLEDNDMLRGFRFFFNNINGDEHDEDDVEEEIANEQTEDEDDEEEEEPKPSAEFIAQKLVQQGVTMEQLVKALLMGHEEYQNDENNRVDDELFGKMRIIISNYTPEQAAMLDQKAINALNDARFSGRNLAGGSAGTAFQQERQAINQGWSNALQLKSADQQLRMQKQQYADQAVRERAAFLDSQRRRAFGDAMETYNVNQESGSALVGAGVKNAIGAFRYQKELEAQERAAKIAGAPVYKA